MISSWFRRVLAPKPVLDDIPAFPVTLKIDGVCLTLGADGTYSGDLDAFETALVSGRVGRWAGRSFSVLAWLVVKEARRMANARDHLAERRT